MKFKRILSALLSLLMCINVGSFVYADNRITIHYRYFDDSGNTRNSYTTLNDVEYAGDYNTGYAEKGSIVEFYIEPDAGYVVDWYECYEYTNSPDEDRFIYTGNMLSFEADDICNGNYIIGIVRESYDQYKVTVEMYGHGENVEVYVPANSLLTDVLIELISNGDINYCDYGQLLRSFNLVGPSPVDNYLVNDSVYVQTKWVNEIERVDLTVNYPIVGVEVTDHSSASQPVYENGPEVTFEDSAKYELRTPDYSAFWYEDGEIDFNLITLTSQYQADPWPNHFSGIISNDHYIFYGDLVAYPDYAFSDATEVYINGEKTDLISFAPLNGTFGTFEHFWQYNSDFSCDSSLSVFASINTNPNYIAPESIEIASEFELDLHDYMTLEPVVLPENANNKKIEYALIEGTDVIELYSDHTVGPLKTGDAVIQLTCGDIVKNVTIHVVEKKIGIGAGILIKSSQFDVYNFYLDVSYECLSGGDNSHDDYHYRNQEGYVEIGKNISLEVGENNDYVFKGWYRVDQDFFTDYDLSRYTKVSDDLSYNYTASMDDKGKTYFAYFEEVEKLPIYISFDPSLVTYYGSSYGQISFENSDVCQIKGVVNSQFELYMNQKTGTHFYGWYQCDHFTQNPEEGILISTDINLSLTINEQTAGKYYIAKFTESDEEFTLTFDLDGHGDSFDVDGILCGTGLYEAVSNIVGQNLLPSRDNGYAVYNFYVLKNGERRDLWEFNVQEDITVYVEWAKIIDKVEATLDMPEVGVDVYYDREERIAYNYPKATVIKDQDKVSLVRKSYDEYGVWLKDIDLSSVVITDPVRDYTEVEHIDSLSGLIVALDFLAAEGYIFTEDTEFIINGDVAEAKNFIGFNGFGGPGHLWLMNPENFCQARDLTAIYAVKAKTDLTVKGAKVHWDEDLQQAVYEDYSIDGVTISGSGIYNSGRNATITLESDGTNAFNYYINCVDENGEFVEIPEFNAIEVTDTLTLKEPVRKEYQFTVPEISKLNIYFILVDSMSFRMNNNYPDILSVPEVTTAKTGDPVEILFETADGYQLSQDQQFLELPGGGGYGNPALNMDFWDPDKPLTVNKNAVDTSVVNRLAWIAGTGDYSFWPNIVFVGYQSADEIMLDDIVTVNEENEYQAPGIVIYNETEAAKEYTVDVTSTDSSAGGIQDNVSVIKRGFRQMSSVTPVTGEGGLDNVIVYITTGTVGDEGHAVNDSFEVSNLKSLIIRVEPGEYVNYSIKNKEENQSEDYKYEVVDNATGETVSTGYVNSDDPTKHLIVSDKIGITSVKLDRNELEIEKGSTDTLLATVNPENTTEDTSLTWASSNTSVVKVDENGRIKAVGIGKAIVSATAVNGVKGECTVTVTDIQLPEDAKFRLDVSSVNNDETGRVALTVYKNYSADIAFQGLYVNSGNATLDVWMKNVASLGVNGLRHYSRSFSFPNGKQVPMTVVTDIFEPLNNKETLIKATVIDGQNTSETTYTVTYDRDKVLAVPDSEQKARNVWMAITENVTAGTTTVDDSYIVLTKGSYLKVGNQLLEFEEDAENLKLDDFNNTAALNKAIRDALKLTELSETDSIDNIEIFLEKGTVLALGQSQATLDKEAKITVNVAGLEASEIAGMLVDLRNAREFSMSDMISLAVRTLRSVIKDAAGNESSVIIEFGHNMIHHDEVAAECEKAGIKEYWECTICAKLFADEAGAREITEEELNIPATGHKSSEAVKENEVAATCTAAGSYDEVVYCSVCGKELSREHTTVPALGHTEAEAVKENEVAATCTTAGSYDEVVYCSVCGKELSRETKTVAALGHDWSDWAQTKAPTCTAEGEESRTCSRCDAKETRTLEALGHALELVPGKAATCTEAGKKDYYECSRCHDKFYDAEGKNPIEKEEDLVIAALGHDWDNGTIIKDPTFSTTGIIEYKCRRCGEARQEELPKGQVVNMVVGSKATLQISINKDLYLELISETPDIANASVISIGTINSNGETKYTRKIRFLADREGLGKIEMKIGGSVKGYLYVVASAGNENVIGCIGDEKVLTLTSFNDLTYKLSNPDVRLSVSKKHNHSEIIVGTLKYESDSYENTLTLKFDKPVKDEKLTVSTNDGDAYYLNVDIRDHDWDTPSYSWSADNKTVTATSTCRINNEHVETETVHSTETVIAQPTCESNGQTVYTAVFTKKPFTTQTKTVADIPATGHNWGDWKYNESDHTHTHVCLTDPSHIETLPCEFDGGIIEGEMVKYTCKVCGGTYTAESTIPVIDGVIRVAGENRFGTSQAIASVYRQNAHLEKLDAVILANGDNFADALAGSYLSAETNAPIIITRSGKEAIVNTYIRSVLKEGGTIYVLGGTAAVPETCISSLTGKGYDIKRLRGDNRYLTNLEILNHVGVKGDKILVATGTNFADSLSASATGLPMLLVRDDGLTDQQRDFLSKNEGKEFIILGGNNAVEPIIESQLKSYGKVRRIQGANRAGTSIEIAKEFFPEAKQAVVAFSHEFPDGLCGGPLAHQINAPLILTRDNDADATASYLKSKGIKNGYVLGGTSRLTDSLVRKVYSMRSSDEIIEFE